MTEQSFTREQKIKARKACRGAVANGKLARQPCEVCGDEKAQAHHDDYSKPLDVRWLCRAHHLDLHRPVDAAPPRRRGRYPHCSRGHLFTYKSKTGRNVCLICAALPENRRTPYIRGTSAGRPKCIKGIPDAAFLASKSPFCPHGHRRTINNSYKAPRGYLRCRECAAVTRLNSRVKSVRPSTTDFQSQQA